MTGECESSEIPSSLTLSVGIDGNERKAHGKNNTNNANNKTYLKLAFAIIAINFLLPLQNYEKMDRRVTRSRSSQGSHMSQDQPKNPLFQIDPTNFFERIKTEEEAIELACQFDMLPRRLMDEDAK